MNIFTHNFNPNSESGPNKFSRQLLNSLVSDYGFSLTSQKDADVEFCLIQQTSHKIKPMILRLDGIYFNKRQDFNQQNIPINFSYKNSDIVVFQSEFNRRLTEKWFGPHPNYRIIHNAYLDNPVKDKIFKKENDKEIWSCASSWRPHKRLIENVRYFFEKAPNNAILYIAGEGITDKDIIEIHRLINFYGNEKIVKVCGNLDYTTLRMLYAASSTFLHLAYLDHCPNVVVDAVAHGCHVVCSSTGGTKEIVKNGTIVEEEEWDFSPIDLYNPPKMDFLKIKKINHFLDNDLNSHNCVKSYVDAFRSL